MVNKDFFQALKDLEEQKGIDKEFFKEALESALTSAYKKHYGEAKSAEVKLNEEKHTIKIYSYKTVVETVEDPDKEISLAEAKTIKKSYKLGDTVPHEETPKEFGRIAAQTAKQVVMQKLREAERSKVMDEVNTKQDEILTAIVRRVEGDNVYCDLGITNVEGILSGRDKIPGENYVIGSRIKVYVKNIRESFNMPYVQLCRSNANFVKRLMEIEIPEISTGEVEIKSIVREAGYRTKVAVYTKNANLDAIGACIGNKGQRINHIISEINGEKIDLIPWSATPAEFIANALSPATVLYVNVNELDRTSLAVVPDDKLSLAIGKSGQNVRLAVRLTNWKIDVKPQSAMQEKEEKLEENSNFDDLFINDNVFDDLDEE